MSMKTKIRIIKIAIVTTMLIVLNTSIALSQGIGTPVYDAKQDFWKQMDKIETKAYKAKDWLYSLEQIKFLRAQFMRMDTLRRATQGAYDLGNKIYDNSKKVVALKDFGLDDAAYMVEKVIDMPIDPSYYMIRAKGEKYNKFVKAVGYNPGKDVDANAKEIYGFLLQYDPNSGAGEGGNQIEIFDDIAKSFFFIDDWRKMVDLDDARKLAMSRASLLSEMERIKKSIEELQKENKHSMTEAERLAAIFAQQAKLEVLKEKVAKENKDIDDKLNKKAGAQVIKAVASEYSKRWSKHILRMRKSKMIGEVSLRKQDRGRQPITKIIYDWD